MSTNTIQTIFFKAPGLLVSVWLVSTLLSCVAVNVKPESGAVQPPLDQYEEVKVSSIIDAPVPELLESNDEILHGRYMVELMGCGACHTDGALIGSPNKERQLAGSHIGIAYSNPLSGKHPGVVFPSNLTPDETTGIGKWTLEQLVEVIRTGKDRHGGQALSVMPWPAYAKISDQDARAIASYLKALKPVRHQIPESNKPGWQTRERYVYFGVYQNFGY